MKQLNINKISIANIPVEAIPALLDKEKVPFEAIGSVNWEQDYPYKPKVKFRVAYTNDAILLNYKVSEKSIRALSHQDNGPVWKDSCVEFFVIPNNDGIYYNIECNCAGAILIGAGREREDRVRATQDILNKVERWSSLGRDSFEEKVGDYSWEVALIIPFSSFFMHDIESLAGKEIRANFYKCGDDLTEPHFLSWNPIKLEKPNFHAPQFFGLLKCL